MLIERQRKRRVGLSAQWRLLRSENLFIRDERQPVMCADNNTTSCRITDTVQLTTDEKVAHSLVLTDAS